MAGQCREFNSPIALMHFLVHAFQLKICVDTLLQDVYRCGKCQQLRRFTTGRTPVSQVLLQRKGVITALSLVAGGGYYYSSLDRVERRRFRSTAGGIVRFFR